MDRPAVSEVTHHRNAQTIQSPGTTGEFRADGVEIQKRLARVLVGAMLPLMTGTRLAAANSATEPSSGCRMTIMSE